MANDRVVATIRRIRREDSDFITPDTIQAYTGCTVDEARAGIVAVFGQGWLDRQDAATVRSDAFGHPLKFGDTVELRASGDLARIKNLATRATVDLLPGALVDAPGERVVDYADIAYVEV